MFLVVINMFSIRLLCALSGEVVLLEHTSYGLVLLQNVTQSEVCFTHLCISVSIWGWQET